MPCTLAATTAPTFSIWSRRRGRMPGPTLRAKSLRRWIAPTSWSTRTTRRTGREGCGKSPATWPDWPPPTRNPRSGSMLVHMSSRQDTVHRLGARLLRTRWLARAPVGLYRAGFGWLFGRRLLMLEHRGRSSGQRRYVVLEVVLREAPDRLIIASGFGDGAQWFQNLLAEPRCGVSIGFRRRIPAVASVIEPAERGRILEKYQRVHPAAWEGLIGIIREATGEAEPH